MNPGVDGRPLIPAWVMERKGAVRTSEVSAEVRALLDGGWIETRNLSEWLVVDQGKLAGSVFPELGLGDRVQQVRAALDALEVSTAPRRFAAVGRVLAEGWGGIEAKRRAFDALAGHGSDVVRSWACFLVGMSAGMSLREKLGWMRGLAADPNSSVRETAWLAMREPLADELESGIRWLRPWSKDPDANVRRFASELTRPRGVWCRHIPELKEQPELGLPILEPLRSDASKYVRDSVANWLNDASKSRPDWVRSVCDRWRRESGTRETEQLVKRALRTVGA
jgi:3-methyladenine DNA glycosylase AlkC